MIVNVDPTAKGKVMLRHSLQEYSSTLCQGGRPTNPDDAKHFWHICMQSYRDLQGSEEPGMRSALVIDAPASMNITQRLYCHMIPEV